MTTPVPAPATQKTEHSICLKVMRLRRPEIGTSGTSLNPNTGYFYTEPGDILHSSNSASNPSAPPPPSRSPPKPPVASTPLHPLAEADIPSAPLSSDNKLEQSSSLIGRRPATHHPVSGMMCLPSSFGQIYVGETFSIYISMHNQSYNDIKNVNLKAELQTASQRLTLLDTPQHSTSSLRVFPAKTSRDFVIEQPLNEHGLHVLVCSVSYAETVVAGPQSPTPGAVTEETRSFRKFYKFPVSHPISMKTKVHSFKDNVFVHAEIQNITGRPLFVDTVKLEPALGFTVQPHSFYDGASSAGGVSTGGPPNLDLGAILAAVMEANQVRRYLFQLFPKVLTIGGESSSASGGTAVLPRAGAVSLGKIDIQWRTSMGEPGRLVTSMIQFKSPGHPDIDVTNKSELEDVTAEEPFALPCVASNNTDKPVFLCLRMDAERMFPISPNGPCSMKLGEIKAKGRMEFSLPLLALRPGIYSITGMDIFDSYSGATFPVSNLSQIYVRPPEVTDERLSVA